jgi:hypothetical protein
VSVVVCKSKKKEKRKFVKEFIGWFSERSFIPSPQVTRLLMFGAMAAIAGIAANAGGGLMWDTAVTKVGQTLNGPVAYYVTIGGAALGIGTLVFDRLEPGHISKALLSVVLAGGGALTVIGLMGTLYGVNGAVI